jgi:hypothetical protein
MPERIPRTASIARRHASLGRAATGVLSGVFAMVLTIPARQSSAGDPGPQLVAGFTRQVQPLILNKCAAGACHGGPSAHAPRFQRGHVSGQIDRGNTLANIESLLAVVATPHDLPAFLATISRRHPETAASDAIRLAPITPQERTTLERWLVAATGAAWPNRGTTPSTPNSSSTAASAAVPPSTTPSASSAASSTAAAASRRPTTSNRFRMMLEAAANPPSLPPPEEPQGIILGKDGGE